MVHERYAGSLTLSLGVLQRPRSKRISRKSMSTRGFQDLWLFVIVKLAVSAPLRPLNLAFRSVGSVGSSRRKPGAIDSIDLCECQYCKGIQIVSTDAASINHVAKISMLRLNISSHDFSCMHEHA